MTGVFTAILVGAVFAAIGLLVACVVITHNDIDRSP
jgi:hypothetical protein